MIYFLNPTYHSNAGDIAIFYSSCKLLNENLIDFTILNCDNVNLYNFTANDKLLVCGGGWLGIYEGKEVNFYLKTINSFPGKIIMMPNSFVPFKTNYELISNKEMIIYARDDESYNYYKKEFKNSVIKKCPDIVFYLKRRIHQSEIVNKCVYFARDDIESDKKYSELKNKFKIESRFVKYVKYDENNLNECAEIINFMFNKIASNEFIITDTLHISIFSYLIHHPCFILDNLYGKLKNTWIQYEPDCIFDYNEHLKYKIKNVNDIVFNFNELLTDLKF